MPSGTNQLEEVLDELAELDVDQHHRYFKHEQKGRERMSFLLLKLNALEKEKCTT